MTASCSRLLVSTCPAATYALLQARQQKVVSCERVPFWADRAPRTLGGETVPSQDVLAVGDGFEMGRITAGLMSAPARRYVVNRQPSRNWPVGAFVRDTVHVECLVICCGNDSVLVPCSGPRPCPDQAGSTRTAPGHNQRPKTFGFFKTHRCAASMPQGGDRSVATFTASLRSAYLTRSIADLTSVLRCSGKKKAAGFAPYGLSADAGWTAQEPRRFRRVLFYPTSVLASNLVNSASLGVWPVVYGRTRGAVLRWGSWPGRDSRSADPERATARGRASSVRPAGDGKAQHTRGRQHLDVTTRPTERVYRTEDRGREAPVWVP